MTRRNFEGDPLEALRRADPLDPLEVPTDTTGVHARALFQEVTSMERNEMEAAPRRQPLLRRLGLAAAGVAVVAAAAAGAYALLQDEAEEVIVGGDPIGSGAMGMCIQYTEEMLLDQDFAFDGTVVAIDETVVDEGFSTYTVTFEVHRWFRGGEASEVSYEATGLIGETSLALTGPGLELGKRFLISGSETYVWGCGYSLTYDTAIANHWAEIFG
jgi:hypothetical protein